MGSYLDQLKNDATPKTYDGSASTMLADMEQEAEQLASVSQQHIYQEEQLARDAEPTRSALGEVATGFYRSVFDVIPKMASDIVEGTAPAGSDIERWADEFGKAQEQDMQLPTHAAQRDRHGKVTNVFASAAESAAPTIAALGVSLINPTAGAIATAGFFGGSSFQDNYEKVYAATGDREKARMAGVKAAAIEGGGEAAGNLFFGAKFLKSGAKILGGKKVSSVLSKFKNPNAAKQFAKDMAGVYTTESITEVGQSLGSQAVIDSYTGEESDYGEMAKETILTTLALSTLLAPIGGVGAIRQHSVGKKLIKQLESSDTSTKQRMEAAAQIYKELDKVDPEAAEQWSVATIDAIGEGVDLDLEAPANAVNSIETQIQKVQQETEAIKEAVGKRETYRSEEGTAKRTEALEKLDAQIANIKVMLAKAPNSDRWKQSLVQAMVRRREIAEEVANTPEFNAPTVTSQENLPTTEPISDGSVISGAVEGKPQLPWNSQRRIEGTIPEELRLTGGMPVDEQGNAGVVPPSPANDFVETQLTPRATGLGSMEPAFTEGTGSKPATQNRAVSDEQQVVTATEDITSKPTATATQSTAQAPQPAIQPQTQPDPTLSMPSEEKAVESPVVDKTEPEVEHAPLETPAEVVEEAVSVAREEGTPLKEQKKYLIDNIDAAIKDAPADMEEKHREYLEAVRFFEVGREDLERGKGDITSKEVLKRQKAMDKAEVGIPKISIHIPDDGTFNVFNTRQALQEFKKRVAKEFPAKQSSKKKISYPTGKTTPVKAKKLDKAFRVKLDNGEVWHGNGMAIVQGEPQIAPNYDPSNRIDKHGVTRIIPTTRKPSDITEVAFASISEDAHGNEVSGISETPIRAGNTAGSRAVVRVTTATGEQVFIPQENYLYVKKHHPNAEIALDGKQPELIAFMENGKVVGVVSSTRNVWGGAVTMQFNELLEETTTDKPSPAPAVDKEEKAVESPASEKVKLNIPADLTITVQRDVDGVTEEVDGNALKEYNTLTKRKNDLESLLKCLGVKS